jgi:HlyD family secretion protein
MRRLIVAIVLVAGFGVLLYAQSRRSGGSDFQVEVAAAERGELADTTLASGNLVYAEQIQLRPEVTGRVAEVLVEEGQTVRKGDLMVRLDPTAFQAELDSATAGVHGAGIDIESRRAQLREATRKLDRQRQLVERRLVAKDTFEQLQSEKDIAQIAVRAAEQLLRQQQARLDLARNQLDRSVFRAPIDGLVVSVDVKPGETVIAGTVNIVGSSLMALANTDVMLAEIRVDEADIARVAIGQPAKVYAAAYPQTALDGRVVSIGSSARQLGTAQGLSFRVQVELEPQRLNFRPGMSCRAEIVTESGASALHVPIAAVRRDAEGQYVWRVTADSRAERAAVTLGMANDISQEVQTGLSPGDRVVVGPGRALTQIVAGTRLRLPGTGK